MDVKVFFASSKNLEEEREKIIVIFNSINKIFDQCNLEVVKWETDMAHGNYLTGFQNKINSLLESCQIAIVVFYSKIGNFTLGEYHLAIEKTKKLFLYFKKGFAPATLEENENYKAVLAFKKQLKEENKLLYKEYETLTEFEIHIRNDLMLYLKTICPPSHIIRKNLTVLPAKTVDLVGRDEELKKIHYKLGKTDRVLLVSGMGGVGKSELCKRYLWNYFGSYKHMAWVDIVGDIKKSFVSAFNINVVGFTDEDNIEERFDNIIHFLNMIDKNTLLIIDNIENPQDEDLDKIRALPIKVIANSRLNLEGFENYVLDFLSPEMCNQLFYQHYRGKKDDEYVAKIVNLCGKHTLTVELLARTAQNAALPVKLLYEKLQERGFNLNDVIIDEVNTFRHKGRECFFNQLLMVFDLSNVTEDELYVLKNLSVLPPIYIPILDFCEWMDIKSKNQINDLIIKGWIKQDEEFNIFMHQVIQEVIRHNTAPNAEKCERLIISLAQKLSIKFGDNPLEKRRLIVFAESILRYIDENNEYLATLIDNLSLIYLNLGKPRRALEFQMRALKIREGLLRKNHPDIAKSFNNLSLTNLDLGKLRKALEFQKKALKIRECVLEEYHVDLAQSYNNLALILKNLGKLEEALEFQKKALKIRERVLTETHPDLGQSYNNLALLYKDLGNPNEALKFQMKDLKILREVFLKGDHPTIAKSYSNLSLIHKDLGDLNKSLKFQKKALEIREEILDKNHPDLAQSYNNLAEIYRAMKKYQEALEYHKKVLEIRKMDENPLSLALSYHNLAATYFDTGESKLALEYQLKNLEILEASFDKDHPNLALSYNNISLIYLKLEDFIDAIRYSEKAVKILRKNFPQGHPWLDAANDSNQYIKDHMVK